MEEIVVLISIYQNTPAGGKLSPGQDATLHILNLVPGSDEPPLILGCNLEGFKECRDLTISHIERNSQVCCRLFQFILIFIITSEEMSDSVE